MASALLLSTASATPDIQHWTTANGARVYFTPAPQLPMVDIRIVFDAGAARDGDRPGLARLTNALLDQGAAELSADTIAERFASVGAQFGGSTARDMAWLQLRSLSAPEYLTPAVATLAQVLQAPTFPPVAFEQIRNRMIAAVREGDQSPGTLAQRAFYSTLYGEHPYAAPPEGNESSLQAITRDHAEDFYNRFYVAANAVVAIVGDLDRAAAEQLADSVLADLPEGKPAPPLPAVPALTAAKTIRIAHPSSQSHVLAGQVGIERGAEDYYALMLANHVLGGNGLVSRLAEEIRQKRGLSYSTYSYFIPMRQPGPFLMGLQTQNERVDEALAVLRDTLSDFVENGPASVELEAGRQNITGGFVLRVDSNAKIAQYLAMIGFYNLPLDYLDNYTDRIDSVSPDRVHAALQQHIQPDQLLTVIVGGAEE